MDFFQKNQILELISGMCLLTVIAMFTPEWSNLQLIGSAITFVQVSIYKLWVVQVGLIGCQMVLKKVWISAFCNPNLIQKVSQYIELLPLIGVSLVSYSRISSMAAGQKQVQTTNIDSFTFSHSPSSPGIRSTLH